MSSSTFTSPRCNGQMSHGCSAHVISAHALRHAVNSWLLAWAQCMRCGLSWGPCLEGRLPRGNSGPSRCRCPGGQRSPAPKQRCGPRSTALSCGCPHRTPAVHECLRPAYKDISQSGHPCNCPGHLCVFAQEARAEASREEQAQSCGKHRTSPGYTRLHCPMSISLPARS